MPQSSDNITAVYEALRILRNESLGLTPGMWRSVKNGQRSNVALVVWEQLDGMGLVERLADDNRVWPTWAIYCGRVPTAIKEGDEGWRFAQALGNKWDHRHYPDALERYRQHLKAAIRHAKSGEFNPIVDAIRSLLPRHALVCSCVITPWASTAPIKPDEPLGPEWKCHCQLIVVAWRLLNRPRLVPHG